MSDKMRRNYHERKLYLPVFFNYFVAFILLATIAQTLSDGIDSTTQKIDDDEDWNAFKQRFNKNYGSPAEDNRRRSIRAHNLELIRQHNSEAAAGKFQFTLAENSLVDLTPTEYKGMLDYRAFPSNSKRSKRSVYPPAMPVYSITVNVNSLPTIVNWTVNGWVGPVENQGQCGSCWAYSAAGSLEAQNFNQTGVYVQLSEQNLIDCSYAEGNEGCNGGNIQEAFWYVQQNGIESLSSYPDTSNVTGTSVNDVCEYKSSLVNMTINSWRNVEEYSESSLQQAVVFVGPVSAAIDANSIYFQLYGGGVYNNPSCSSSIHNLDHAILVIGYGVYKNASYWLIQNSWGTSWGMNGYMMMARDANNMCGIASAATFPVAGIPTTLIKASAASRTSSFFTLLLVEILAVIRLNR